MILSIIIPVYNEEKTIIKILEKIKKNKSSEVKYEIIVIDDGSSDQTKKILEDNKDLYNKLLINETNKGKGFSVKKGILNSTGTHIIFQDADLEYDPSDYIKLENQINMKYKSDTGTNSNTKIEIKVKTTNPDQYQNQKANLFILHIIIPSENILLFDFLISFISYIYY